MKKFKIPRPFKSGFIHSNLHAVSFQVYGNPKGAPWMFCHGGSGFSQPSGELKENTTAHLINDMR